MEWDGKQIVFTVAGRGTWDALTPDQRTSFLKSMSGLLELTIHRDRGVPTDLSIITEHIDNIKDLMRVDEIKECVRTVDSNLRMFIESKLSSTINEKGKKGEQEVISLLEDTLMSSDGYSIQDVSGLPGNCDILVQRTGHPDVRIDVKNWSAKVGQRDIDKFVKDLTTLNSSGIMVSLKSGIVGKRIIELEQLPTGKFALYLSNVSENSLIIPEFVRFIHTLEDTCQTGEDTVRLTKSAVTRIELCMADGKDRVNKVKQQLYAAIAILNEMNYDRVLDAIHSREEPTRPDTQRIQCTKCNKTFANLTGLKTHTKTSKCSQPM